MLVSLAAFALSGWAHAGEIHYAYCPEDAELSLTKSAGRTTHFSYVGLSSAYTQVLDGCKITAVKFAVGSCRKSPNTNFSLNITTDYLSNSSYEYQQTGEITPGTASAPAWNTVALAEPYQIEAGKPIYVGYQVDATADQYPWAYAADYPVKTGLNDITGYTLDDGTSPCRSSGYVNPIILVIEGDNAPAYDLELVRSWTDRYGYSGHTITISAMVKNNGSATLSGYSAAVFVSYTDPEQGEMSYEGEVISVDKELAPGAFDVFTYDVNNVDEMAGRVKVALDIDPRGAIDQYPDNNSATVTYTCLADAAPRKVLMESLMSIYDVTSVTAYERLEAAAKYVGYDNVIQVRHYADSDELTSPIINDFQFFYWPYAMQLPAVMMDRTQYDDDVDIPITYPYENTGALCKEMFEIPACVELWLDNVKVDEEKYEVSFDLLFRVMDGLIEGRTTYFNAVLVEDSVVGYQKGADNYRSFTHNRVARSSLGDAWGVRKDLDIFTDDIPRFTLSLNGVVDSRNLSIVGFFSYYDGADPLQAEVLNATELRLDLPYIADIPGYNGVSSVNSDSTAAYALDGRVFTALASGQVITLDGRVAANLRAGETATLRPGFYILSFGQTNKKICIR